MAKGMTYSLTDMLGNKHTRYSARHIGQQYTHAVVRYRNAEQLPSKADVTFHSRKDLANREHNREADRSYQGKPYWYAVTTHELHATEGRQ